MKIAIVCNYEFTYQKYLSVLAAELLKKKFSVSVFFAGDAETGKTDDSSFIDYFPIQMPSTPNILLFWRAALDLRRKIKKVCPDVIILNNRNASLVGRLGCLFLGRDVKILYFARGMYFHDAQSFLTRVTCMGFEYLFLWLTDGVISQTREDINTLLRMPFVSPSKFCFVGNGIDSTDFSYRGIRPRDPGTLKLVSVGRMVPEKGFVDVLRAMRELELDRISIEYTIVGGDTPGVSSSYESWFNDIVKEYGLVDSVRVTGFTEDVAHHLGQHDIFIQSSHREGFPRALLEALAIGLPCIATNIRGARELVIHGENGFLFERGDVEGLTKAIKQIMLMPPSELQKMSLEGRAVIDNFFNEKKYVERQVEAILRFGGNS